MKFVEFESVKEYFCNLHDKQGQLYADEHPYSFHLKMVAKQAELFKHLIEPEKFNLVLRGCYAHDAIEDCRMTYNDIKEKFGSTELAEIVFLCTEMRGRNRAERKPPAFYEQLAPNKLALFVKLCDIIANVKYSLLTNSGMYKKYQQEFEKLAQIRDQAFYAGVKELRPMFNYLEDLLKH